MPRKHKRNPGSRHYKDYSEETLLKAVDECKHSSIKDVSNIYKIPIRTLRNKVNGLHKKSPGRPAALTTEFEETIANHLKMCADYGMPLEMNEIQYMVKAALDKAGMTVSVFKNNFPGIDWARGFCSRNKDTLCVRTCQNIKRSRAEVDPEQIKQYFNNLAQSLENVDPGNILNYDETNLSDDPGQKKCIFRRGIKYPEKIMNYSKGNISLMFSGTAKGELLPPYVIYKLEHLWRTWCEGGPAGTRFGRSKSGWMDTTNFEEWFLSVVVPWARRKEGKKVIIGDNLSSHFSGVVLEKCLEWNIGFVLLPPNSTGKCQPLDVSFFTPLKKEWRKQLGDYRQKNPSSSSLGKSKFPSMLNNLLEGMGTRNATNLVSGFRACGIFPLNAEQVLRKYPTSTCTNADPAPVADALLDYLQTFKYSPGQNNSSNRQKRTRLNVAPGKSISGDDLIEQATSSSKCPATSCTAASSTSTSTTTLATACHASSSQLQPLVSDSESDSQSQDIRPTSLSDISVSDSDDDWLPSYPKKKRRF